MKKRHLKTARDSGSCLPLSSSYLGSTEGIGNINPTPSLADSNCGHASHVVDRYLVGLFATPPTATDHPSWTGGGCPVQGWWARSVRVSGGLKATKACHRRVTCTPHPTTVVPLRTIEVRGGIPVPRRFHLPPTCGNQDVSICGFLFPLSRIKWMHSRAQRGS